MKEKGMTRVRVKIMEEEEVRKMQAKARKARDRKT
jgi:hypothetical protein